MQVLVVLRCGCARKKGQDSHIGGPLVILISPIVFILLTMSRTTLDFQISSSTIGSLQKYDLYLIQRVLQTQGACTIASDVHLQQVEKDCIKRS